MKYLLVLLLQVGFASPECKISEYRMFINGTSMSPTLKHNQEIRVEKNYFKCNKVKRGDIAIFQQSGNKNPIIKFVKGIPGDRFEYKDQKIYINGILQKNSVGTPYKTSSKMLRLYAKSYPILPPDSYLVLGDDPNGTLDSSRFGLIGKEQMIGRALLP